MSSDNDLNQYSTTPFARVLMAYMWSKVPPWNAPKVAAVLGIQRTRVNNWLQHNIVPEIDTMFAVMARLGIPLSRLVDAYNAQGLPVPQLTETPQTTQASPQPPASVLSPAPQPATPTPIAEIPIPPARRGRKGAAKRATEPAATEAAEAAEARPAVESGEGGEERGTEEEWEQMIAHTRRVMSATGMPEAAIDAVLAEIQSRRTGQLTRQQRRIAEEFGSQPSGQGPDAATDDEAHTTGEDTGGEPPHRQRSTHAGK